MGNFQNGDKLKIEIEAEFIRHLRDGWVEVKMRDGSEHMRIDIPAGHANTHISAIATTDRA